MGSFLLGTERRILNVSRLGEIFTFLSRRDSYWVNVERTIWKNNPLLKTKDYPATERGIVPFDYVIEMNNSKQNEGMSSPTEEDRLVPNGDESQDNVFKLKSERDGLAEELEQLKRKLDEAYKENATFKKGLHRSTSTIYSSFISCYNTLRGYM
ncbi:hypothetical protein OS493_016202 [Desmophyllum pertusum]|uniref:Uncharacterized protein n=1 Tax=Desmophyllum pertusum TaxID=174260 RepID=A0A9X0A1U2_9CNID|nr:hypothetical protein OS493_016202 [Desmophyllum pertusum]